MFKLRFRGIRVGKVGDGGEFSIFREWGCLVWMFMEYKRGIDQRQLEWFVISKLQDILKNF